MYKRLVEDALRNGVLDPDLLPALTDEGLIHLLEHANPSSILDALRNRRLYKRALEWPASQLDEGFGEWISTDRDRVRKAEKELAKSLGLNEGEVLLDYPMKTEMLGLDIPVKRRDGLIEQLTSQGWPGSINLPMLSKELYLSARWMRVFVAKRMEIAPSKVKSIIDAVS